MGKISSVLLISALLTGCAILKGSKASGTSASGETASARKAAPTFALPGVPLKNNTPPPAAAPAAPAAKPDVPDEEPQAETPAPEEKAPAAAAAPAAAKTAPAAGDLEFHMDAAKKYALKKRYKSAAAEYAAAVPFVPAGDARAVQLLERQGAMLLRSGSDAKAQEAFQAAIKKAADLKAGGNDLANAHLGLGYCYEKKGNIPEAVKNYEKAIEFTDSKKVKDRVAKTINDLKAPKK